jgi:hypothetical protein
MNAKDLFVNLELSPGQSPELSLDIYPLEEQVACLLARSNRRPDLLLHGDYVIVDLCFDADEDPLPKMEELLIWAAMQPGPKGFSPLEPRGETVEIIANSIRLKVHRSIDVGSDYFVRLIKDDRYGLVILNSRYVEFA